MSQKDFDTVLNFASIMASKLYVPFYNVKLGLSVYSYKHVISLRFQNTNNTLEKFKDALSKTKKLGNYI